MIDLLPDALADALGVVVADVRRECRREIDVVCAESRATIAELRAALLTLNAEMKAELKDAGDRQAARVADAIMALPIPKDGAPGKDGIDGAPGKDAAPDLVADIVTERLSVEISDAIRADVELIRADVAAIAVGVDEKIAGQVSLKIGELKLVPTIETVVSGVVAALPRPKDGVPGIDGKDADPAIIAEMVADEVAKLPPAEPGKSVDPAAIRDMVSAEVEAAVKALPLPVNGHTPTDDDLAPLVGAAVSLAIAALPRAKDGEDGKSLAPADVADMIAAEVAGAVAARPFPADGHTPTAEELAPIVDMAVRAAVDALPRAKDGEDGKAVDLEEVRVLAVAEVERAMSSADDCVPDYLAETVSKAISTLAESPPIAMTSAPSIVLNISGGADRRSSSKTITTRRDDAGNLIAEVTES